MEVKITIVYDNTVYQRGLEADWGFACFIEAYNRRILFDTGAHGSILLDNMKKLNIEPGMVDEIFISHDHWDHTGGLSDILKVNPVKVCIPSTCLAPFGAQEIIKVKEPVKIGENIFSTGELEDIEQSMVITMPQGAIVIVGCAHPGVEEILKAASQYGTPRMLIGGLHGFDNFDLLKDMDLICPTHCTQFQTEIKSLYPQKYIAGGAGRIIEI